MGWMVRIPEYLNICVNQLYSLSFLGTQSTLLSRKSSLPFLPFTLHIYAIILSPKSRRAFRSCFYFLFLLKSVPIILWNILAHLSTPI